MQIARLENIVLEERQRKVIEPESVARLSDDIQLNGLYHPILVRPGSTPDTFILVAGERRLRAISNLSFLSIGYKFDGKDIQPGHIPVTSLSRSGILAATEAELNENILREPITWQERVLAESRLVELRNAQALEAGLPAPSLADVADSVEAPSMSKERLFEATRMVEYLSDPEVAKAPTRKDARKIVERKRQEEYNKKMAEVMKAQPPTSKHIFIQGVVQSPEVQKQLAPLAGTIDGILVDPPYYRNLHQGGTQGNADWRDFDDSSHLLEADLGAMLDATIPLLRADSHLYIFAAYENVHRVVKLLEGFQCNVWPRPLIWAKGNTGVAPVPDFGPRYTYECIVFARRGMKKCPQLAADTLFIPTIAKTLHPDEKPVALYTNLLSRSAVPGETWLDFCCGSGTIFAAANQLSLKAIGVEKNDVYAAVALNRINKEV